MFRVALKIINVILLVACIAHMVGCTASNWTVSVEERELSYQVTDRLRLDVDDAEIVWECKVKRGLRCVD